jgi:hypothetical protein
MNADLFAPSTADVILDLQVFEVPEEYASNLEPPALGDNVSVPMPTLPEESIRTLS